MKSADWDESGWLGLFDGGYIIATSTASIPFRKQDLRMIKTDSSGTQQWHVNIGGPEDENSFAIQQNE